MTQPMLSIMTNTLNTSIAIAVADWRGHGRIARGTWGIFGSRRYGLPLSFIPVKSLDAMPDLGYLRRISLRVVLVQSIKHVQHTVTSVAA